MPIRHMPLKYAAACLSVVTTLGLWLATAEGQAEHEAAPTLALGRYEGFAFSSRELTQGALIDGVLRTLHVRENDAFNEGDMLASMDDSIQALAVAAAELQARSTAAISAAQARLAEAEVELENQRDLAQRNSATDRDVRRAEAQVAVAQAELEQAKESRAIAEKQAELEKARLERYTIRATFDGVVTALETDEGAALRQNDPILRLAQINPLEAKINLPVQMAKHLTAGSVYRLRAGEPVDAPIDGRLTGIAREIDRGSQTIQVTFEIDNPGSAMPAGFRFKVESLEPVAAPARAELE